MYPLFSPSLNFCEVWFLFANLPGNFCVLRKHSSQETYCVSLELCCVIVWQLPA